MNWDSKTSRLYKNVNFLMKSSEMRAISGYMKKPNISKNSQKSLLFYKKEDFYMNEKKDKQEIT